MQYKLLLKEKDRCEKSKRHTPDSSGKPGGRGATEDLKRIAGLGPKKKVQLLHLFGKFYCFIPTEQSGFAYCEGW